MNSPSIRAPIILVSTMVPVSKEPECSPAAAFLAFLDRNAKLRSMRVTPTPATMVQHATVLLLVMPVLVQLALPALTAL